MVLIMTEWQSTQNAFANAGYSHQMLHHVQATSGTGTLALEQVRRGDFAFVWIDLPSQRTLDTQGGSS